MADSQPPEGLRMIAYRAARDWARTHFHQQPDDRMVDAVLAALFEACEVREHWGTRWINGDIVLDPAWWRSREEAEIELNCPTRSLALELIRRCDLQTPTETVKRIPPEYEPVFPLPERRRPTVSEPWEYVFNAISRTAKTWVLLSERIELSKSAVAALEAAGYVLLPSGGEVSTQFATLGFDGQGRRMPGLVVHHSLEAALAWKARLEADRSIVKVTLVIYQRQAHIWEDGSEHYLPWSPVLSDNSEGESGG